MYFEEGIWARRMLGVIYDELCYRLILSHFDDKRLRKVTSGILGSGQCCDNCRSGWVQSLSCHRSCDDDDDDVMCLCSVWRQVMQTGSCRTLVCVRISWWRPSVSWRRGLASQRPSSSCGAQWVDTFLSQISFTHDSLCNVFYWLCLCQNSQRVPERFRKHSVFGIGKEISECWWKALGRELIAEQYLTEATGHNKFATLCKLTSKVLFMFISLKIGSIHVKKCVWIMVC